MIGSNGSGKTTFLKMLLGEEQADQGVVELGANVKYAYLPQKLIFINEELTVLEAFREDISILEGKAREYLAKFMFYKGSVFKKVKHLSGGERIRLKLAMLLFQDINLLILDEPTNHLDIDSIETLEEALEDFKGTIFFNSHDRYFINKMSQRVIAVEDCGFMSYDGDYDYYRSVIEERKSKFAVKELAAKVKKQQKQSVEVVKEEDEVLSKIDALESELDKLDKAMISESMEYEELHQLYRRKDELSQELDSVLEAWMRLAD
jgi:ATP-binding cassette, subfamily F, member 3